MPDNAGQSELTAEAFIAELEQAAQSAPTDAARKEIREWRDIVRNEASQFLPHDDREVHFILGPKEGVWKQAQLPPQYVKRMRGLVRESSAVMTASELIAEARARLADYCDPKFIDSVIRNILSGALRSKEFGLNYRGWAEFVHGLPAGKLGTMIRDCQGELQSVVLPPDVIRDVRGTCQAAEGARAFDEKNRLGARGMPADSPTA